jgi:toxin FitB
MMFLLDATTFSDLMRERAAVRDRLSQLSPEDRDVVSPITRGEILYGIRRLPEGKRRRNLDATAAKLFGAFPCEPVPPAAADHYAEVKLTRERKGLAIDENDLWIASTALATGATLVSRDTDFHGIAGLTLEDWSG